MQIFSVDETVLGILCECDAADCEARLTVSVPEYEHVRSDPLLFFVVPGHEDARIEQIVRQTERCLVVRKRGEAAEIADETAER